MKHPLAGMSALACIVIVAGVFAVFVSASPALAQTPIPLEAAATGLIDYWAPVFAAGVAWMLRKVPSQFAWVLTALRVDQLLGAAVTYGINATKNAVKGRTLTLPVGNEVARIALDYAIAHAPQLVAMFGVTRLREKILARLDLDEAAEVPPPAVATK